MKLTKNKLSTITKEKLIRLDYLDLEDNFFGAEGLFSKQVARDFFLTLGLTISRHYEARFSASYYLSKTTRWGSLWGDIPKESYKRVSSFLTAEEKKFLLDNEFNGTNIKDAWWRIDNESVDKFIATVKLTEERFLGQPELFKKVENSFEVRCMVETVDIAVDIINSGSTQQDIYNFIPPKSLNNIPLDYFKAAEAAITKKKGVLNVNTVKALAADIWYQHKIKLQ